MSTRKVALTLDAERCDEASQCVGRGNLPQLVNEALRHYLQAQQIREIEAELVETYGPISEEAKARVAEIRWVE